MHLHCRLVSPIVALVSPRGAASSTIPQPLTTGVPGAPLRIPIPVREHSSVPWRPRIGLSALLCHRTWSGCTVRRPINAATTAADRESQQREHRSHKGCHARQRRPAVPSLDAFQLECVEWMDLMCATAAFRVSIRSKHMHFLVQVTVRQCHRDRCYHHVVLPRVIMARIGLCQYVLIGRCTAPQPPRHLPPRPQHHGRC